MLGGRGLQSAGRHWWELRKVRREAARLEREGADLSRTLKKLKTDDSHLERVARKELGLMKPGEVEYRFPPK